MQTTSGVITCDKCGKPMKKGRDIIVIADGTIAKAGKELDF